MTAGDGAPYDLTSMPGPITVEPGEELNVEHESPSEDTNSEPMSGPGPELEPIPVDQPRFGHGGAVVGVGAAWYLWWRHNDDG